MKKLLYIVFLLTNTLLMAQSQSIIQKWKEVDQQLQNGQFKSLQPKLDEIKAISRKENNQQSVIKALFYEAKIKVATSDEKDDVNFVFDLFKKEITGNSKVNDAITNSYLAQLYQLYYNENRWKINSRTNVENQSTNDVRFWTEETFKKTIDDYYSKSIVPKNDLVATKSSDYKIILNVTDEAKTVEKQIDLTPTLYDVLTNQYINYLNSENQDKKVNDLYTDLIAVNRKNNNQNAELYNELRLLDTKRNTISASDYRKQKEALTTKYPNAWFSAYVFSSLAKDYYESQENKLENTKQIFAIQDILTKQYPNSNEKLWIDNLVDKIKSQEFKVDAEKYLIENANSPIKISHKNLNKLYVKILEYNVGFDDNDKQQALYVYNENRIKTAQDFLNKLKTVSEYSIDVKSFDDYQFHSSILKLNPLASGRYIVLFSTDPSFKISSKDAIDYVDVSVSKYALNPLRNKISVVNRETGKPESNISVEIQNLTNYNKKESKILVSDKNGEVLIPDNWQNVEYRVKNENTIYSTNNYRNYYEKDESINSVKIFSDRAIYRPGQTVYFKGIYYNAKSKNRQVIPNSKLTFILNDVNGKEVSKVELTTNEFGSANGSFVLPISVLTGDFSIQAGENGYYSFKVEEYKRPKFEVEIEKNKGVYSLNDEVKVDGKAVAFSGANIDNAKVNYRVYRQEIFTFWPWYRIIPQGRGQREEITFGETTTDTEGKFNFNFVAKPASEKKKDEIRTYNYFVEVNVTDINGETQTATSSVKVGDTRMVLNVNLSERTNVNDLKSFKVDVKNLNDEKLDGKGHVEIYSLNAPKEVFRSQKFKTDYNYYSKEEFKKLFPNEPYGDEMDPKTWTTNKKVFESDFDTKVSNEINFNQATNLEEGYYVIKGYVLDGTQKVEVDRLIYVSNDKKADNIKTFLSVTKDKNTYEPKDVAKIDFKSGAKGAQVYYEIEANQQIIEKGFLDLDKKSRIEIPIKDEYRGGIYMNYVMTKYNDVKSGSLSLPVPFTDKTLKVTAEVLRDKLTPGAKEKWQLKIEGPNKDKVSAEILASMYDASLDQFASNSLDFNVYDIVNPRRNFEYYLAQFYSTNSSRTIYDRNGFNYYNGGYTGLNLDLFDFGFNQYRMNNRMMMKSVPSPAMNNELTGSVAGVQIDSTEAEVAYVAKSSNSGGAPTVIRGNANYYLADIPNTLYVIDGVVFDKLLDDFDENNIQSVNVLKDGAATALYGARGANGVVVITTKKGANATLDNVKARTNLNETAFFYPNLKTDAKGNVIIEFTSPESLTEWKFMAIAHTPDLKTGYLEQNVRTQKDLMVVPNMPRFLREGDKISISSKINNLSDNLLNGSAKLMLFDAFTNQPIDAKFNLTNAVQNFSVAKGSSDQVTWTIDVPKNISAVVYRVVASAGDFSDGEESALPILTNRMMVTETLPIYVKEGQKKTFQFENMMNNKSTSLDNFKLTFEMTTNPIWYAIFSLPYLREYPYECAEQVFSRLYGNMISQKVINSNPKIKAVFDDWNKKGELKSKLQLNQELKNIILEGTPWVRNAESEEEQMKQIAVLFQLNQMQTEMKSAFQKLMDKQQDNGGFAWFEGGRPNEYITTHIVSGFGNMKKMNIDFKSFEMDVNPLIKKAIQFIDNENLKRYNEFKKDQKLLKDAVYSDGLHYLYARSFFLDDAPLSKDLEEMKNAMLKSLNDSKLNLSLQQKAMAAVVLNRFGKQTEAKLVVNSVKETSVLSDEMGMYWKANQPGWFWYQAPVETQSLLIEAFDEVTKDEKSVEEMKVWLLKNRQTNQWNSTKATTKAVYALMNFGKSWIDADKGITVKIGSTNFDLDKNPQAGSGYVKTSWNREEIKPDMGKVEVAKTSPGVAWGAMYWQYFEDLDKIKSAETGIKFNKKLFVKSNSANGPVLKEITSSTPIKVGDIVTVRLEISVNRAMQFVHIKDMRASGFEPVNVLSGYKWKGEFGYYESTRDAATNFFSDYMNKGTYVFEYDLKANNAGNFSNGITSMQNMYAPELSAQSEGIRVEIK